MLILASLLFAAGCACHADRLREVRTQFYQGSVETASITLDKYISNYPREAEAFKLDRAVVELAAGRPKEAEKLLREARDALDYNSQASLAEKAGSMLTDDTHTAYAGEDYEKILVRAMLAISNLMSGGEDATAYALQVSDVQERIIASGAEGAEQNPKLSYKRVALGEYIHGAIDEASRIDYNEAARSYTKVCSWEPSFPYGRYDVERAMHGHHSQQGNGVLYVFALVGRGPYKEETVEVAATISMFAASAIVNATAKRSVPPSIAPIKVPKVIVYHNSMNSVFVSADGRPAGPTATITDVGKLAVEQYQAIYPRVVVRAVLRRAAKEGIIYGAQEALKTQKNGWASLALDVGGIAWEATESADCRCWGLLPDRIQVLRVELPAGDHQIHLQPDGGFGGLFGADTAVRIEAGTKHVSHGRVCRRASDRKVAFQQRSRPGRRARGKAGGAVTKLQWKYETRNSKSETKTESKGEMLENILDQRVLVIGLSYFLIGNDVGHHVPMVVVADFVIRISDFLPYPIIARFRFANCKANPHGSRSIASSSSPRVSGPPTSDAPAAVRRATAAETSSQTKATCTKAGSIEA